jgi:2-hydroxy-3-oxopropionate reductase
MVAADHKPQARLSQHLKDVKLIVAAAEQAGLETPLSRAHQRLLERAESFGFGDSDNSAVIEAYRIGADSGVRGSGTAKEQVGGPDEKPDV